MRARGLGATLCYNNTNWGIFSLFSLAVHGPKVYKDHDKVDLFINKVQSDNSQLPYSYYELPFTCSANEATSQVPLSLGQIFRGDRIVKSDYQLSFKDDSDCAKTCVTLISSQGVRKAQDLIKQNYSNEWIIDGLPSATTLIHTEDLSKLYRPGFPIGFMENGKYYLNNHAMILIRFHREANDGYSIVGFEVYPKSVATEKCPGALNNYERLELSDSLISTVYGGILVPYTYAVYWREETEVNYENRWELYMNKEEDNSLHYFSLVYSLIFTIICSVIVGLVLAKLLRNDIKNHNRDDESTGSSMNGWRKLRNDVFSSPSGCLIFCILVGAGIQLLVTVSSVVFLFAFKILDNNVPGKTLTYATFLFILSGGIAGYVTYFFYDNFVFCDRRLSRGRSNSVIPRRKLKLASNKSKRTINSSFDDIVHDWFHVSLYSGAALAGFIIFTVLFLNFFIWAKESSTALPFGTIVVLIVFYFFCEIPLALIGGYIAYKNCLRQHEQRILLPPPVTSPIASPNMDEFNINNNNNHNNGELNNKTTDSLLSKQTKPSMVPNQPFYLKHWNSILISGLIPFICFYIELFYIYKVIWLEKNSFYYLYGFLFITIVLLLILVCESVIIALYLQLNNGDYRWQWKSFFVGGAMANYVMMYSIFYFVKHLRSHYDFVSSLLYFTYSFLIYLLMVLSLGSVGSITGYLFVKKIYGTMKID
ncbi:Tmn3 protein [Saccharomycopsis crataegensis]|uniref:Transmembrane 9 superfamily member n=1 Tax=Saccharomycopsis crataegensis TaxID=43959 RepID=A0AAV5QUV0_9ASCO|nr:Tmn3 protein [Saccharomycopsis crataegensis]